MSAMWQFYLGIAFFAFNSILCDPVHIHLHPEVAIVDYTGPLHHEIFQIIRGVERLEIINSNITRMDGKMLAKLPKLKKIIFINCTVDIDAIDIENLFLDAVNLKEFVAVRINARELRPEVVNKHSLEVFILTDNNYPKLPGNLMNETKLKILDMARNHLQTIEDGAFNGLNLLEKLDLSTNELSSIPAIIFKPLKSVKVINLAENKLTKFIAKDLPELPNLEKLNLSSNPLKEVDLEGLKNIAPKLTTIDISGSSLTELQITDLKSKYSDILKIE